MLPSLIKIYIDVFHFPESSNMVISSYQSRSVPFVGHSAGLTHFLSLISNQYFLRFLGTVYNLISLPGRPLRRLNIEIKNTYI